MDFGGKFTDHIIPSAMHQMNISFVIEKHERYFGGCGPNIAYTMSLLHTPVTLLGMAGRDFDAYTVHLHSSSYINADYIRTTAEDITSSAYINTDRDNNQLTAFYPGAGKFAYDLPSDNELSEYSIAVVSPENKDMMLRNLRKFADLGLAVVLDSGQMTPYFSKEEWLEILPMARVLLVNDYESKLIEQNSGVSIQEITKIVPVVVVTKGGEGSDLYHENSLKHIGIVKPSKIVDPTGAGDAYRGGFLAGMSRGYDWETCSRIGATAATYAVEQRGNQVHDYDLAEFLKRYTRNF